jgi:hypothetical protein
MTRFGKRARIHHDHSGGDEFRSTKWAGVNLSNLVGGIEAAVPHSNICERTDRVRPQWHSNSLSPSLLSTRPSSSSGDLADLSDGTFLPYFALMLFTSSVRLVCRLLIPYEDISPGAFH